MESYMIEDAGTLTDILLAHIMGIDRETLYQVLEMQLPDQATLLMNECALRLSRGIPVQYIMGSCYFYGLEISVGPGCFIPRSDTEVLVKSAITLLPENGRFVDICSGSGCISKAIAHERPDSQGLALEYSLKALEYTEENLKDSENVAVKRFDALDEEEYIELASTLSDNEKFDMLVCNPPYIPTDDMDSLSTQVRFEPDSALDGGEDGMRYYVIITKLVQYLLKEEHTIIYEVGIGQAGYIEAYLKLYGYTTAIIKDLGGIERVVIGTKGGSAK